MKKLGVYVHIPFCLSRCTYCDFTSSILTDNTAIDTYVEHILKEIDLLEKSGAFNEREIETIYFGGGTPSLLKTHYFRSILERLLLNRRANLTEVTIEANPATVDEMWLNEIKSLGINRISFGVQSLNDLSLKAVNRRHTAKEALDIINLANLTKLSINVDLMIGLPYQTKEDIKTFVDEVTKFENVNHVSTYMLSVEDGTKLANQVKNKEIVIATPDEQVELFNYAKMLLEEKGFVHYEVSNFARPGYEAKHNLKYWTRDDYIGLGISSHSLVDNVRFYNPSTFDEYYKGLDRGFIPMHIEAKLDKKDIEEEYIMLAFRTNRGLNFEDYKAKFGKDFIETHKSAVDLLKDYLIITDKSISIDSKYFNVLNQIVVNFI